MSDLTNMETRVGITTRKRERARTQSHAPTAASVTIAAMLGASSPATAAKAPTMSVITLDTQPVWKAPKEAAPIGLSPQQVEQLEQLEQIATPESVDAVLNEAVTFAQLVNRVMPVDEATDHEAELALAKHAATRTKRKLTAK